MNADLPVVPVLTVAVLPLFGPDTTAKSTGTPARPVPQPLAKVAVTVALTFGAEVVAAGARSSFAPGQGALPARVHWVDSLDVLGLQEAASTPPVLRTRPASLKVVRVPPTVTDTLGTIPELSQ